jgi:hypothetical protein
MPQLDIYTYFTQFQWFLLIFILLFLFINNQFIPAFQSLFIIRSYIKNLLESQDPKKEKDRLGFDFEYSIEKKNLISTPQSYISQWDKIYDAQIITRSHSNSINKSKSKSNKLNDKNIINPAR